MAGEVVRLVSRPGSPITLVFLSQGRNLIPRRLPAAGGVKYTGGGKNLSLSIEVAVYVGNSKR